MSTNPQQDDERRLLINQAHEARIELEGRNLVANIRATDNPSALASFRARLHEWVDSWGVAERLTPPAGSNPPTCPGSPAAAAQVLLAA